MASVVTLKNLGPVSARVLADVGIETAHDLREVGAEMAFRLVTHRNPSTTLHLLYALVGALSGRHWASFSEVEKASLLAQIEAPLEVRPGVSSGGTESASP